MLKLRDVTKEFTYDKNIVNYIEKRSQAEAWFKRRYPKQNAENVSDFGAYCVEKWLSGRDPRTAYGYLAVDFLREFAYRNGKRGSSDLLAQASTISENTEVSRHSQHGADSDELRRFVDASLFSGREISREQRIILRLFYEWQFTFKEIGALMDVSESRISQMHTKALRRKKESLQEEESRTPKRVRQSRKQKTVPRKVQTPSLYQKAIRAELAKIQSQKAAGILSQPFFEIQKTVQKTFRINTF